MGQNRTAAGLSAPDQGAHACLEFGQFERLAQIVVGAQVEPLDAVGQCVACSQNQHRRGAAAAAEPLDHLEAVDARQAEIKNHQIVILDRQDAVSLLAVVGDVDCKIGAAQGFHQPVGEYRIVFDYQYAHDFPRCPGVEFAVAAPF